MKHKARTLWPTISDFEKWCGRNCITCRWRYKPNFERGDNETCRLLSGCLAAYLADEDVPSYIPPLIFHHTTLMAIEKDTTAPHFCASRKDKRGRTKSEAF